MEKSYPWTSTPLIALAPMRIIALSRLAVSVSAAGGLGFIGAGSDLHNLDGWLSNAASAIKQGHPSLQSQYESTGILPIGFGIFNWALEADIENYVLPAVRKYTPAVVWMFGALGERGGVESYAKWAGRVRDVSKGRTKIWIQVGSVADAIAIVSEAKPDVLVVQGTDAGGHGLARGAGVVTLVPEVIDRLEELGLRSGEKRIEVIAAGGIIEGRAAAAALCLGADGVCMGTRFLACPEAEITDGYRNEVIRASDGGMSTARTNVYDQLRGTTMWPKTYNARGVLNQSYFDSEKGVGFEENKRLYDEAMKSGDLGWGEQGRVTTYAGTGVGLVRRVMPAGDVVREVQTEAVRVLERAAGSRL